MIKIAITGNIASGKSLIQTLLKEKGFKVFDADKLAHEVLNELEELIIDLFSGYNITENNKISKKKLGKIIFSNPDLKSKLETVIHPKVKDKIKLIFENNNNSKAVFIGIPLLYETGFDSLFDKVITVYADDNIRIDRIKKRDNLSLSEINQRMNSQMSQEEKIKLADFSINNNSDKKILNEKLNSILKLIQI